MSKRSRRNHREKAKSELALSRFIFVIFFIVSIGISVVCYMAGTEVKIETAARILELEDWKFHSSFTSKNPKKNGNFYTYYYLCEFTDENGNKTTALCLDTQEVPSFYAEYQEYIKYQRGDIIDIYYYPEKFIIKGQVYVNYHDDYNPFPLLLILFWGMTIVSFFTFLSDKKAYRIQK